MKPSVTLLSTLLCTFLSVSALYGEGSCYYDVISPVAICDAHTVVALNNQGTAKLFATDIDDGSYDNCQIVKYEAARMFNGWCPPGVADDTYFRPYVEFCCADVGQTIWVQMKVTDAHGNANICMAEVTVQDNINGQLICPPNITISCSFWFGPDALNNPNNRTFGTIAVNGAPRLPIIINDPGNTSLYQPYNWGLDGTVGGGNCGYGGNVWVSIPEVIDYRNSCGVGIIKRKFFVQSGYWSDWCYQTITVKDFSHSQYFITWPKDYEADGCLYGPEDVTPDKLSPPYNKPSVAGGGYGSSCGLIGHAYDDLVFTFLDGACYKILREWTVIDWCKYQPNNPWSPGIWKHTQIIKLKNMHPPVFVNSCKDLEVPGYEPNCSGRYLHQPEVVDDCTPTEQLKWHYKIDLWADGSFDIIVHGTGQPAADKVVPNGWHKVLWYVEDQCGNATTCLIKIHVVDKKAPTPVCYYGLATVVMPIGGMVTIWAKDFDVSSYDNCTPRYKLKFSFSSNPLEASRTFTCDDLGTVPLQIWAHDEYGNKDYCTTYIKIGDNEGACSGMNGIQGLVSTFEDIAVPGAKASMFKVMPDESLDDDISSMSDVTGHFQLGFGTTQYDRMIKLSRKGKELEGISTLDIIALQRHINGTELITEPHKIYAADLDGNGRVGANDLQLLHKAILGGYRLPGYKGNLSWVFFGDPCGPQEADDLFNDVCHNGVEVSQYGTFPVTVSFKAIKMGDVNGDMVNTAWLLSTRTASTVQLIARENASAKTVEFVLARDAQVYGLQFSVNTAGIQLHAGILPMTASHLAKDKKGYTNISWGQSEAIAANEGDVLFSLSRLPVGMPLDELLVTEADDEDALFPEIYTAGLQNQRLEIRSFGLDTEGDKEVSFETRVSPNPFTDYAMLEVLIPAGMPFQVSFYDISGRVIFNRPYTSLTGDAQIVIDPEFVRVPGVYYYRVTSALGELSGKFVKQ